MPRGAVLFALLLAVSCKKQPAVGDLPPTATPATPAGAASPQPAGAATPQPAAGAHAFAAAQTPPRTLEALPDGRLVMGPFSLVLPAGWTTVPVTSNMRAANFQLPGKPGEQPQLLVTYFGPKGAGSIDDNVGRWIGQFTQPDGKPSRDVAKIEKPQFAGQDAVVVTLSGHYAAPSMGGGGSAIDKQDQALLAAIVASPAGPYYFKVVADKPTIAANTAAFRALLASLTLR